MNTLLNESNNANTLECSRVDIQDDQPPAPKKIKYDHQAVPFIPSVPLSSDINSNSTNANDVAKTDLYLSSDSSSDSGTDSSTDTDSGTDTDSDTDTDYDTDSDTDSDSDTYTDLNANTDSNKIAEAKRYVTGILTKACIDILAKGIIPHKFRLDITVGNLLQSFLNANIAPSYELKVYYLAHCYLNSSRNALMTDLTKMLPSDRIAVALKYARKKLPKPSSTYRDTMLLRYLCNSIETIRSEMKPFTRNIK